MQNISTLHHCNDVYIPKDEVLILNEYFNLQSSYLTDVKEKKKVNKESKQIGLNRVIHYITIKC